MSGACDPMDWESTRLLCPRDLQARILEWAAISFSRGSPQPRNQTWVSCIAGRFFTTELQGKPYTQVCVTSVKGNTECYLKTN